MKRGYVYIMTNEPSGTLYIGVTSSIAARVHQHRTGHGSDFCKRYGLTKLVYVEMHDIAFFAPGGAGGEFAAVGHDHLDGMIVRMGLLLHRSDPLRTRQARQKGLNLAALYRTKTQAASRRN